MKLYLSIEKSYVKHSVLVRLLNTVNPKKKLVFPTYNFEILSCSIRSRMQKTDVPMSFLTNFEFSNTGHSNIRLLDTTVMLISISHAIWQGED